MSILLNLLLSAAQAGISGQRMGATVARLARSCLLILIAIVLALAGLGFGLYAAFAALVLLMSPTSAAAVLAAAMLTIAAALATIALRRPGAGSRKSREHAAMAASEAIDSLANSLRQWVRTNPGQAAAVAAALGFIAGSRR
jgi:disulfide bond formation protein DsbB